MNNPWTELPQEAPYIAEIDKGPIKAFPKKFKHLRFDIQPDPYMGSIENAEVVLLVLNPGFIEEDMTTYKNEEYAKQNRLNLLHQAKPRFYVLNQEFHFSGGYQWWMRILRKPIEEGLSTRSLAEKLLCLQYFPYHSSTYTHIPIHLPSQMYTFAILREAIKKGKTIVIMRSKKLWTEAVPELKNVDYIELKNYRNPVISPNNMNQEDYAKLFELLS